VVAAIEALLAWHYRGAFAPLFGAASRP